MRGVFRRQVGTVEGRWTASTSRSVSAKPWGSSARAAAASRPRAGSSCASTTRTAGSVVFRGTDITSVDGEALRRLRPRMQMIFQDPQDSLNPAHDGGQHHRRAVAGARHGEGPGAPRPRGGAARRGGPRPPASPIGNPHEFSGGQAPAHRGGARARRSTRSSSCATSRSPRSTCPSRPQVVNLLEELQDRLGLTYLFISHDLSMIRHIADRVAVMYLGKIVELAHERRPLPRAAAPVHAGPALRGADPRPRARGPAASGSS